MRLHFWYDDFCPCSCDITSLIYRNTTLCSNLTLDCTTLSCCSLNMYGRKPAGCFGSRWHVPRVQILYIDSWVRCIKRIMKKTGKWNISSVNKIHMPNSRHKCKCTLCIYQFYKASAEQITWYMKVNQDNINMTAMTTQHLECCLLYKKRFLMSTGVN